MNAPYVGRNNSTAQRGRRRVKDYSNQLNPGPIQTEFGLPGDYRNPQLEFLTRMTVPTLTQICRLQNLHPALEARRTKGHLVQLIVSNTSLGAILEQVMVDGQHNIFAPLHGDTGNL
jgi:hypothetical protein